MTGLRMLNEIMDPATREATLRSHVHLARSQRRGRAVAGQPPDQHRAQ